MKTRIKIDTAILCGIIIFTGLAYKFSSAHPPDIYTDGIFSAVGFFVILCGVFLRMVARGYKKAHSQGGHGLVVGGPYQLVRNPMYFGSFLLGTGFVLILWPWWSLPVFAYIFYLRFIRQIKKEEVYLSSTFGQSYEEYLTKVPRLFPDFKVTKNIKFSELFPFRLGWSTKEKWGLAGWPAFALFLDLLQENTVYGAYNMIQGASIFALSVVVFLFMLGVLYKYE